MRITTTGFKELEAALAELKKTATAKAVMRRSLKKAAQPMADAANAAAPTGPTGAYAQSFKYSTKLSKRQSGIHRKMFKSDKATVEGFVGTSDPAGVQQEFGNVNHGPQPALRPAWDAEAQPTLDRIGTEMWADLAKTAARAAKKAAKG